MKQVLILMLIISVAFVSCKKGKKIQVTGELIPAKKMVELLVDIHLADAIAITVQRQKIGNEPLNSLYSSVFNKHGCTRKQFENSIAYYSDHLEDYEKIYDEVIETLSKMESRYSKGLGKDEETEYEKGSNNNNHVQVTIQRRMGDSVSITHKPDSTIFRSMQQAKEQMKKIIEKNREKNKLSRH
ncbi:MAG: DUF4296 domain-containing protein [Bacteroidia bacterium]|nr:DUF4296 domain-containing protein [Bacteroidia bacterium]